MKSILKSIFLLLVSAITIFMSSCATATFVQDGTGKYYAVSVNSYGNYDLKGKTYYIESGDETISSNDLEFKEYASYLKEDLKIQGAQEIADKKHADMCILLNYCITDKSYQESIPVPEYGRTTVSSTKTEGNTTTYQYNYGTTGYHYVQKNVSNFLRIVNIYAYDNKTLDSEPIMVWKTNLASEGSKSDLRKIVPHLLYVGMGRLGKSTNEEEKAAVDEDGYLINYWKQGKMSEPNFILVDKELPLTNFISYNPNTNSADYNRRLYKFIINHIVKQKDETIICIKKMGYILSYNIPTELYICANGKETKVGYAENYSLGQTLKKECGPHVFILHFPVSMDNSSSFELREYTNNSHTRWKSWGTFETIK